MLSVMSKWYMACLVAKARNESSMGAVNSAARADGIYGYVEGHRVEHVTEAVRNLRAVANEWGGDVQAHFAFMDIYKAFDSMTVAEADWCLRASNVTHKTRAAVLDELVGNVCRVDFQGHEAPNEYRYEKMIRTGGKESPWLWNLEVAVIIKPLIEEWSKQGAGLKLQDGRVTHWIWADNFVLVSDSKKGLVNMVTQLTKLVYERNFRWKPDSLAMMTCGHENRAGFLVDIEGEAIVLPAVEEVELLGVQLTEDMHTMTAVKHRVNKARTAWFIDQKFYTCRSVSFREGNKIRVQGTSGDSSLFGWLGLDEGSGNGAEAV